jgi:hypothetical protein
VDEKKQLLLLFLFKKNIFVKKRMGGLHLKANIDIAVTWVWFLALSYFWNENIYLLYLGELSVTTIHAAKRG